VACVRQRCLDSDRYEADVGEHVREFRKLIYLTQRAVGWAQDSIAASPFETPSGNLPSTVRSAAAAAAAWK